MAIFVPGTMCSISNKPIARSEDAVTFPVFVANEADPLYIFSDAVIDADVFSKDPRAGAATARFEEFRRRTTPENRLCAVCGRRITDPDDYIGFGHLVADVSHPLYDFNYTHIHKSCVRLWERIGAVLGWLATLQASGAWGGNALTQLIDSLRTARSEQR